MSEIDILVTTVNAFAYVGALYALFWPDDRWPFTLLILALAAGHIAVARVVPDAREKASSLARYLYAGMGLTFATMAIPIRLNGKWITFCFAVEGAVLIWSGFRAASGFLRQFGYLLLAIAAIRVLIFPPPAGAFLVNQRFAAYLLVIACFGVALWSARDKLDDTGEQEKNELGIFSVLINVFALIALSLEFWDYFGKDGNWNRRRPRASPLALRALDGLCHDFDSRRRPSKNRRCSAGRRSHSLAWSCSKFFSSTLRPSIAPTAFYRSSFSAPC